MAQTILMDANAFRAVHAVAVHVPPYQCIRMQARHSQLTNLDPRQTGSSTKQGRGGGTNTMVCTGSNMLTAS